VLDRGLGFALSPGGVDVAEFAAAVESGLGGLARADRSWVRREVAGALKGFKRSAHNLSKEEREAFKVLRGLEEVMILPADKGSCTVVLDTPVYKDRLGAILREGPYEEMKRDPGQTFRKRLATLLRPLCEAQLLERGTFLRLCPTHFDSPYLFGLPKVHKVGCPLRPIVGMRNTLFAPLSRFLADVLAPYAKEGESYVQNSVHAKERLTEAWERGPGTLASFDVVSLFTNIPVTEAVQVIEHRLVDDSSLRERTSWDVKTLCELISFCLTNCYFRFGSSFYVQKEGVAMGSSLGCTVAVVYMNFFESMALASASSAGLRVPDLWIRYVDDVLVLFRHSEEDLRTFFEFINSLRNSIKFTLETEEGGSLPYLDLWVMKTEGRLRFSVYRKDTHSGRYLNRTSCHPRSVFRGLVNCLKERASLVCSRGELPGELSRLHRDLRGSGFTSKDLAPLKHISKSNAATVKERGSKSRRVCIPYVPGLSERVGRIFRRVGSEVSMRPQASIGSLLCRKKPRITEPLGVVYKIPCADCTWAYVGETGRTLTERLTEHKRAVRNCSSSSEIATHVWSGGHRMNWAGAEVLARDRGHFKRVFKEAWFTRALASGNRTFHDLDPAWSTLF
jgi:hypothetical protein